MECGDFVVEETGVRLHLSFIRLAILEHKKNYRCYRCPKCAGDGRDWSSMGDQTPPDPCGLCDGFGILEPKHYRLERMMREQLIHLPRWEKTA